MSAVTSFSRTAASNNSAPPNGAPEGQASSTINDCIRELMKAVVDEATFNACKVLASVAGTNTITGTLTPDLAAYSAGMIVVLTPANTNTGATTLNIDSLGALDVFNIDGSACVGGELVAGIPALLVLDSGADDWIIVNPNVLKSRAREVGTRGLTFNSQAGNYTLVGTDYEKTIIYSGTGGHTITLATGSVLQASDVVKIINAGSGNLTIASGGTLGWLDGSGAFTFGSRTLAVAGSASAILQTGGTQWLVEGVGLT